MVFANKNRATVKPENAETAERMFQSALKLSRKSPSSPGTHATFFTDDEEEEKKNEDGVPLLSSAKEESRKPPATTRRRMGNSLKLCRKQKESKKQQTVGHRSRKLGAPQPRESEVASSNIPSKSQARDGRFSLADFGRRISSRISDRRVNSKKPESILKESTLRSHVEQEDDEEQHQLAEQDPVIQLFESRNTQRVRFALEGHEEGKQPTATDKKTNDHTGATAESDDGRSSGSNIKQFMSRALFGSAKSSKNLNEEMKAEVASLGGGSLVWESSVEMLTGPEVIHTAKHSRAGSNASELVLSFTEDPKVRAKVEKLLDKARKAEHLHFRYEYAVKCYLKVLSVLKESKYPDDHPTVARTMDMLNNSHHVLSSYNNSANIVKMGIKYEDAGELIRALKMYTIAYRIRRDNLSRNHPSLVVLLNMLGSIQIKRGELHEAMQIYELALMDSPITVGDNPSDHEFEKPPSNLLAKSVTYREMGVIYERWGQTAQALNIYHKSLECVMEWKEAVRKGTQANAVGEAKLPSSEAYSLDDVHLRKAVYDRGGEHESGEEMEVYIGSKPVGSSFGTGKNKGNTYNMYFPADLEHDTGSAKDKGQGKRGRKRSRQDAHADMDLALTLHQIAQLHRSQGEYAQALDAYIVALRGMKYALGKHHTNVAAVLGNIGNLQKEMGDMDAAYTTYQEVLGIESYRLGLSNPEVAITLHNIATIDAARGNYDHALQLYRKVIGLEKKLFGDEHISVAVAAACMGDVFEKLGDYGNAMEAYEEAVRIKTLCLGRHSVDVARLLHKLGKLAFLCEDYHMAESFLSRALLMYRLNKVSEGHPWMLDANRDSADIDAALAMDRGRQSEC